MTEKLLYERLREWGGKGKGLVAIKEVEDYYGGVKFFGEALDAMADEIERDYIPRAEHEAAVNEIAEAQKSFGTNSAHYVIKTWAELKGMPFEFKQSITEWLDKWFIKRPLYDYGQPVQFGDTVEIHDRLGKRDEGRVQEMAANAGPVWILSFTGVDHKREVRYSPAEHTLKRPEPKVLDADGVEINVGDTVYLTGHLYGVEWPEGTKCTVVEINHGCIYVSAFDVAEKLVREDMLTHKEPDSLEKLQQFAVDSAAYADGCEQDKFLEIADRLKALIERGA